MEEHIVVKIVLSAISFGLKFCPTH